MKRVILLITTAFLMLTCGIFSYSYGNVSAVDEGGFEVPKIEFCQVQFILDYEKYYGIFLDSNRDVYSFAINNVTEDWNLYGDYSEEPIKLTAPMPQGGLLDYLYEHPECCKLIGKTSLEDYENYKSELEKIDLNTEMEYRQICEPTVIGLGHTERFAVRYDDNGDRKIVFLCGGIDTKYDLYLENLDEYAIALNSKMIQYEEINESAITTTVETDQTTAGTYETTTSVMNVNTTEVVTSKPTVAVSTETFSSNDKNIAFVYNDFSWGSGAYSYSGIYVTENGDVYKFAVNNHESWTYRTFDFEYVPIELYGYADLSDAFPQTSMLQELNSTTYEKVGNISTEEVDYYLNLLYSVDENQDVICEYRDEDDILPYSETWGVRKSDSKVIFLNGGDDIHLTRTDENSDIIDKWLTSLANNYITSEVDTTFSTTTTTTVTTTENTPNPDTTTTTTDSAESTIATTKSTTTIVTDDGATEATNTTTPTHIASDEELCDWAVKDYEKKTGVTPENAEIEYTADGNAVITLTDAESNVLDVYNIDPFTGTGTESDGGEVNLPQTGYSVVYNYIMLAAAAMVLFGIYAMAKSRKKDEE